MNSSIIVNVNEKKSTIEPDIYGHFSEHLGRCIYGGLWVGKDSPIPNIDGYRKDVVEALKKIRIPNLRWPGGCFADEYHWKDGIGPQENRKRMVNTHWGGVVEDNSFGTHEFMNLCELLECKAYVNGNVGSGTVQEMSEWVEYITFAGESPMSKLREENGRKEPWTLPYFCVGNENWGCGGNMTPEYYADLYRRFQTYVRQYNPDKKIYKIAGGANVNDYNWTEVLMQKASRFMDGLSLHYYTYEDCFENKLSATKFDKLGYAKTMKHALWMDELVRRHGEIMDKYDPEKRIGMVVDEWGCWHAAEPGTNPGFLYQQNTLRDALVAGVTLNIFNNHSDRVRVANLAQAVNVLQSVILTEGDKMVLTPTYHVFDMYKNHMGATLLDTQVASGCYVEKDVSMPMLNVSSSMAKDGSYTVTVCNLHPDKDTNVSLTFEELKEKIAKVDALQLTSDKLNAMNTFKSPNTLEPTKLKTKIKDNTITFAMSAKSVVSINVTTK